MIKDLELKITRLDLRPGDVLVVKISDVCITSEVADAIRKLVNVAAPNHKVLVLDRQMDLAVLTAAEIADHTASRQQDEGAA